MQADRERADWTGRDLGRYRVLGRLGSGGMGVVYEAEDTVLQRRVALKTLPHLSGATPANRERLIGEARAAARISHPHVVTIHDVDTSAEIDFLVMELLPLGSLGQWLAQHGPLPWELATRLVAQACAGLTAAHAAGIVHRDIKPSNLMLVGDCAPPNPDALTVKIGDFGISRLTSLTSSCSAPTAAAGTVHFMSPEQCEGEAEPRSDLYSLGATYYTLLTGRPPFVADHPLQVMFQHCASPIPDPRERSPGLPADCTTILSRAMAKQPGQRYASAREMQQDLERLLAGESPLPIARSSKPRTAAAKPRRSRRTWIAALGAAFAIVIISAAIWSQRASRETPARSWPEAAPAAAAQPASVTTQPAAWAPSTVATAWRPGFREMPGEVRQVALSHDGRYLACALNGGGGLMLDIEGDERTRQLECPEAGHVRSVAFAADSQCVVAGIDSFVQSHCFSTGRYERLQTLKGLATVAISRCGKHLAVGEDLGPGQHGRIWLHEIGQAPAPENLSHTREIEFEYSTGVVVVAFSPDSQQVAAGSEFGSIGVYDVAQAAAIRLLNMPEPQRRGHYGSCLAYSPDSTWLAAAGDQRVVMWDTLSWAERVLSAVHQGPITHLVFSPDGRWLITAASDGLVRWDVATGEATSQPLALNSPAEVRSLVFLGGDQWLLSGAADKRFLLWNWREAFAVAERRDEVRRAEGLRR